MKRPITIALIIIMIVCLAACSKTGNTGGSAAESTAAGSSEGAADESKGGEEAGSAKLDGKLIAIPNDKDDIPELHGVSFFGNRAGTAEFNSKAAAKEGIRCVFELNEYFGCTLDTDATYGIKVYILKHRDDQKSYETTQYSDLMPGFVNLYTPVFDPDENAWTGELYISPDDAEPGYYDFVFTYEGTPFAKLYTRFFAEDELSGKSDSDLEKLING